MRTITVFSTKGGSKEYQTEVEIWGDLRNIIKSDYDVDNLKATESENKTSLESAEAVLPKGNFILYLRPDKQDGNNQVDYKSLTFKELRQMIKEDDQLKWYLSHCVEGKNYTQLSKEELILFLQQRQNVTIEEEPSVGHCNQLEETPEEYFDKPEETTDLLKSKEDFIDFFMDECFYTTNPALILEILLDYLYPGNLLMTDKEKIIREYNNLMKTIL
jgi:hypothetical protein